MSITNSSIVNNSADRGGGISNEGTPTASVTVTSSTIAHNHAGSDGGGILNYANLTVTHSTIANNSAGQQGGGIFSQLIGDATR